MALARLHGGPLDGQIIPVGDAAQDSLIVPYGATQLTYRRAGEPTGTGTDDGPTEIEFRFAESADDLLPGDD